MQLYKFRLIALSTFLTRFFSDITGEEVDVMESCKLKKLKFYSVAAMNR